MRLVFVDDMILMYHGTELVYAVAVIDLADFGMRVVLPKGKV